LFALGVVMFEMVTGTLPWIGATPMASAVMRLHEPAPSATARVPELPVAWERTIARCLEREPEDRFAGVGEVMASLRSAAPGRRRRSRRERRLALAGIAAVVAAAGVVAGVYAHDRGAPPSSESPRNPLAAHLYREALAAMTRFQPAEARRELEVAAAIEPDQPLVYAALAKALHVLKADEPERVAAKKAFELSTHLDKAKRLDIEASYRESTHDWAAAAKLRLALATFYPDNLEYGLALAEAQRRAAQGDDALATLGRLRRLAPPNGDDPRLDVMEAKIRTKKDPAAAERLIEHAVTVARARGAAGIEADAHVVACNTRLISMQVDPAIEACSAALAIYETERDLAGQAQVYASLAGLSIAARRSADIERYSTRALELYRQVGSRSGELNAMSGLAIAYRRAGNNRKAEQLWREAVAGFREAGETHQMIVAMDDLAGALTDDGLQAEAIPLYRELIKLEDANGLVGQEANTESNFSIALVTRGELEAAAPLAADAVAKWKQLGEMDSVVYGLDSMGQIAMRQARLADARALEDEALAARLKLGWPGGPSRQNLANIDLEERNYVRAEALARKAVEEFRTANEPRSELYAHDILVRALVEQGHVDDAQAAADRMSALAKQVGAARVTTTSALSLV
ncbi:MAG TPA: tetratricopeptide repeat protein, partial [Kofleriaceae bacterium]